MYNEFSTSNIQVDKDFSAKLSGYGCVSYGPEIEITNSTAVSATSFLYDKQMIAYTNAIL